jgi:hypothetical protein
LHPSPLRALPLWRVSSRSSIACQCFGNAGNCEAGSHETHATALPTRKKGLGARQLSWYRIRRQATFETWRTRLPGLRILRRRMSKQKIGAREAVNDIKSGMSNDELMQKYHLTAKGLESLFQKVVQAGLLEKSFLLNREAAGPSDAIPAKTPAPVPTTTAYEAPAPPELLEQIAGEIGEGLHDYEIMRRHELPPGRLNQIKAGLIEQGRIDAESIEQIGSDKTKRCPFCSKQIKQSAARCLHCGNWLEPHPSPDAATAEPQSNSRVQPEPEDDTPDDEKVIPWEERDNYGTFKAYYQTAARCLLTPTAFFSELPTTGGYGNPILFGVMTGVIGFVFAYLWFTLISGQKVGGVLGLVLGIFCATVGALIMMPLVLGIWSAILHGCLYLVGGASRGYQATFRVVSYSQVPNIFNAIPVIGIVASLWVFVLTVIGLRETHQTSTGKAAAAVLIPIGIAVLCGIIAMVMGAAMLYSGLMQET